MSINSIFKRRGGRTHPREDVRYDMPVNEKNLQEVFADCGDFETRQVWLGGRQISGVSVCWLDGVVSGTSISEDVIRPLSTNPNLARAGSAAECMALIERGAVYSYSVKRRGTMDEVAGDVVQGCCAIVFDSAAQALTFEVKTSNTRSISEPTVEKTVKGAKDAFVETLRTNTSLVRRKLHDPELKVVQTTVGRKSATQVAVLYVNGIANEEIIQELQKRLDGIDIDALTCSGDLEQYVTDAPRSPFPQLLHTERPDKFAAELLSGRVGFIADGLPIGFLTPAPMAHFMRVNEDRSQHFMAASMPTILRWLSLVITILLPASLVAISMYHQEMIPFRLMVSMIDAKQKVPFTASIEMLSMLVAFELIQEAGARLPNPVGDTLSIIGALIVGQAAVEARVVSPVAVIVVATAGICGFTQPSQDMLAALRIIRIVMVLMAIALGMFGIMLTLVLMVWHLCSIETFGVSYTEPLSEKGVWGSLNVFLQFPLWREKYRPVSLRTYDRRRQK